MKILIAGGSGFIGRNLSSYLSKNHSLTLLTRYKNNDLGFYDQLITWDSLNKSKISKYDIVINLCGYDIAKRRWSRSTKQKIISSRTQPTTRLVELIADKNIWLINFSAIGYYKFSKLEQTEANHITSIDNRLTFSQEIVSKWENIILSSDLKKYSILRLGVVIGRGGILDKMISSAKFGFIAMLGNGDNIMSWISVDDLIKAISFIIDNNCNNKMIINLTTDNSCQHQDFVKLIKKYLSKKYILRIPNWLIRIIFGQMGQELLLSSHNIKPNKLIDLNFKFDDDKISKALQRYLKTDTHK